MIFQIVYFLICFGTTWIPVAGILFPLPFFLMILIRQHLLPKFFDPNDLRELDAAEYEELEGVHLQHTLVQVQLAFCATLFISPDHVSLNNPLRSPSSFVNLKFSWLLTQEEDGSVSGSCDSRDDAEILDEFTTNRGELKHRAVSHRDERHLQVKNWP